MSASWGRGQSLVEFALVFPVLLLVVLIAVDFGRAMSGWVVLQNASRIAANYAGLHPDGWRNSDSAVIDEYSAMIGRELGHANCTSAGTPPGPAFADGPDTAVAGGNPDTAYDVGDSVRVSLSCDFHPITPIISAVTGSSVTLSASSEFTIRAGRVTGLAHPTEIPPPGASPSIAASAPSCPDPVAEFSGSPLTGSGGSLVVSFTDLSTSAAGCSITSWTWTFGDGQTSTQQNPTHLYTKTSPGSSQRFDVTLTVGLASGQSDSLEKSRYVTVAR